VKLFISELKDLNLKLYSIRNVSIIAVALGPEKNIRILIACTWRYITLEKLILRVGYLTGLPTLIFFIHDKCYSYLVLYILMVCLFVYHEKELNKQHSSLLKRN
jgi:hypothetical protein